MKKNILRSAFLRLLRGNSVGLRLVGFHKFMLCLPNELTNHLGNVLSVVSDELAPNGEAQVISAKDYYPFGMSMPGRGLLRGVVIGTVSMAKRPTPKLT